MKRISSFLIVIGVIGVVGPFFGLGLRGMETAEESIQIGGLFLVLGLVLLGLTNLFKKTGVN